MKREIAGSMGETKIKQSVARQQKILSLAALSMLPAAMSYAQGYTDTLSGLRELGFDPSYIFVAVGLGALLILFYVFSIIFRKIQKGKRPDVMAGLTYLDVTSLGKEGLLTPEEQAKIREAMSRQIARQQQQATTRPAALPGELSLLADPEVQRLEALAQAKKRGENPPSARTDGQPPSSAPASTAPGNNPHDRDEPRQIGAPLQTSDEIIDPIPSDWKAPTQHDDVVLPPDVLALAKEGLITPEELEKIKIRMRAKQ